MGQNTIEKLQNFWIHLISHFIPVVTAVLSVKLDETVTLEKNHFAVVFWEHFKLDHLWIQAPFKLHWQVGQFIASYSRLIDARCHNVLAIFWDLNVCWHSRHIKILDEFYSSSNIQIFALYGTFLPVWKPLQVDNNIRLIKFDIYKTNE